MGWDDCFDFAKNEFTQPNTKATEIWRVLKEGGRFVCCSWYKQCDVSWMEAAIIRHYPAILEDSEYLRQRPIGMAYEKPEGYEIILKKAGFKILETFTESMTFVSTDEDEWWRQLLHLGWESLIKTIEQKGYNHLERLREGIFQDLQPYKHSDGIRFEKEVFFISAVK